MRNASDLALAKELAAKLDEEKGIQNNLLLEDKAAAGGRESAALTLSKLRKTDICCGSTAEALQRFSDNEAAPTSIPHAAQCSSCYARSQWNQPGVWRQLARSRPLTSGGTKRCCRAGDP